MNEILTDALAVIGVVLNGLPQGLRLIPYAREPAFQLAHVRRRKKVAVDAAALDDALAHVQQYVHEPPREAPPSPFAEGRGAAEVCLDLLWAGGL